MNYITVSTSFASTHRDEAESPYIHGHTFFVSVTEKGFSEKLHEDLADVAGELHLHSLEDMLVGGGQGMSSLAAWFMERLLLRHPRISRVEVWYDPEQKVGVEREIR